MTSRGSTHVVGKTRDFMRTDVIVPHGMVWDAVQQEVLKETHILQCEEGYLLRRLQ